MSESMEVEEQVYEEETPSKIPNHRVYANHTSHGSKRKGKKTSYIMWAIQAIIRPVKKIASTWPQTPTEECKVLKEYYDKHATKWLHKEVRYNSKDSSSKAVNFKANTQ